MSSSNLIAFCLSPRHPGGHTSLGFQGVFSGMFPWGPNIKPQEVATGMSREGGSGGLSTRQQQTSSNLGKVWFGILQQEIEENIDFLPFVGKKNKHRAWGG